MAAVCANARLDVTDRDPRPAQIYWLVPATVAASGQWLRSDFERAVVRSETQVMAGLKFRQFRKSWRRIREDHGFVWLFLAA